MDRDLIEKIKNRSDIVAVVSEHVTLTRKGKSYWGLCPFHNEKTSSFHVDPGRQMYKCFGCGAGGDVIGFLMEVKGLSFREAVEELAQAAGIAVEWAQAPDGKDVSEKKMIYEANRLALEYFRQQLFSAGGRPALEYLRDRGLRDETIKAFYLGYAPDSWDGLIRVLANRRIPLEMAEKAGLVIRRNSGSGYYDRFRGRVIFPIMDLGSEVVGFGGRIIGQGEPKYLNTPESPVFEKRRILYNLVNARNTIRTEGVVVVEGYMDVVSLANAGFDRAVASLGTAFGEDHVRLLKRFTDRMTLIFDGDAAGRKAMLRSAEAFLTSDVIPQVAMLPQGKDPDDMARNDIQTWNSLVTGAGSIWDFIINESFSGRDPSKLEDQNVIVRELAPVVGGIGDQVVQGLLVERISTRLGINPEVLKTRMIPRQEKAKPAEKAEQRRDILEDTLVRLMLLNDEAVRVVDDLGLGGEFSQADIVPLVNYLLSNGRGILEDHRCPEKIRRLASAILSGGNFEGDFRKALIDTVSRFMNRVFDRDIKKLQFEIAQAEKIGDKLRLLELTKQKQAKLLARRNINKTVAEVL